MSNSRSAFSLVALAFLWISWGNADAQKAGISSMSVEQQVLFLNLRNNGQHLAANVGQQIEISLGAMAPCDPQVSSSSIRLESVALPWPANPGLATHVYIFHAAAEGEAEVKIPITDCSNPDLPEGLTFTVTIRVGPAGGGPSTPYASRTLDQANTAPWDRAATNLLNNVRQTFTPSLPRLTGVEVELVFPNVGLPVSPGQVYSIQLSGGTVFGWKYVVGGYASGAASFNGKPLLGDTRSTFLFRTFGAS
jgi:hypothetical protein